MNQKILSRQPKYTPGPLKQAMCHTHIMGLFSAIPPCPVLIHGRGTKAQAANGIGRDFASSAMALSPESGKN
jgi:hypothetical protein